MSADNIIHLPIAPRATAIGDLDEIALPGLRLPRRVYGRLLRQAKAWNVDPQAAAEMLLLQAINEAAGNQDTAMIAALFVESGGAYFGLPDVDPWDKQRDAMTYAGPWPVVAHPPCQRWGRFWHGSTRKPHQFKLGDDGGCFEAARDAVIRYGGVIEHPAHSKAWDAFGLTKPPREGGWVRSGVLGATCYVEQGFYGHPISRKPTWLYACHHDWIDLRWGVGEQRLHPIALAKHGYEKARRIGMVAMVGGKDKTKIRNATPPEFRDLLISIAASAAQSQSAVA